VGERVAEALGFELVDSAFIDRVSERAGLSPEDVARLEERSPSFLERLARTTALELPELFVASSSGPLAQFEEEKLVKITRSVVTELANRGSCVLVGRASSAVLAERRDVLHVKLVASREFRLKMAIEIGVDPAETEQRLDDTDRNRERYHSEFYARDWNDPLEYDLVLNTGRLGLDGASQVIVARSRAMLEAAG